MSNKQTKRWIFAALALSALLVVAIIINKCFEGDTATKIASTIDIDNGDQKINWDRYPTYDVELSDSYQITKSGTYHFTGAIEDGLITSDVQDGVVKIILDNVRIINNDGPAIACYSGDDLVIELVGDNSLSDGASYSSDYDEDVTGAIYSKADLTFQGSGTLSLTANYQDGIVSKDDLKFSSGSFSIVAEDDGVRGKDSVYIAGGEFNINSKADGIKSTNENDVGKGFVLIEAGNVSINSGDDGIHASNRLIIKNGTVEILEAYEGLEAPAIVIDGGEISLYAIDDGINAGNGSDTYTANRPMGGMPDADENCIISINGGNIYINASGDGIDSNGYLEFNGGNTIVDGPTNNGNGALDAGISISMNGGEVIAVGSNGMAESLGETSSVFNISVYFSSVQAAGTKIEIKTAAGETILEHTSLKSFSHLAAGSAEFILGETYTIYLNGAEYQSFTISNITTTVGNYAPNNMMPRKK